MWKKLREQSQPWSREREGYKAGWTRVIRRYSWCEKQVPAFGPNDTIPTLAAKNTAGVGAPGFSSVAGIGPNRISHRTVTIQNLPMVQPIRKLGRSALVREETRPQTKCAVCITSEQRTAVELKNEDEVHIECCDKISHADRQPN
jgi:hypothetical protein